MKNKIIFTVLFGLLCLAVTAQGPGQTKFYEDKDRDGWGTGNFQWLSYPSGDYVAIKSGDCDDNSFDGNLINPDMSETCDGKDNNCDGSIDNVVNPTPTKYNLTAPSEVCANGTGTVTLSNSQSGVSYRLYRNNVAFGSAKNGSTGSSVFWSNATPGGTYKVIATHGVNCGTTPSAEMNNQVTIGTKTANSISITLHNIDDINNVCPNTSHQLSTSASSPSWQGVDSVDAPYNATAHLTLSPGEVRTVTLTADDQCGDERTTSVTLRAMPTFNSVTIGGGVNSRCEGAGTTQYTATAINATSFFWELLNAGASTINSSTGEVTWDAAFHGAATVKVTASNACSVSISTTKVTTVNELVTFYEDKDRDGFYVGDPVIDCTNPDPVKYVTNVTGSGDCDDIVGSGEDINPNTVWYLDNDGDGYSVSSVQVCERPTNGNYILSETLLGTSDCDDGNLYAHAIETWFLDADGDGYALSSMDNCGKPGPGYTTAILPLGDCDDTIYDPDNDCSTNSSANSFADNYVYSRQYQDSLANALPFFSASGDLIQQVTYFDGLGRPVQQVGMDQSPLGDDIVTHMEYDDFGRMAKEYLPYVTSAGAMGSFKTNPVLDTESWYDIPKYDNTLNPYSEKGFEPSPLSRVLKQAAPGNDWAMGQDHEITFEYKTNLTTDNVRQFDVDLVFSGNTYTPTLVEASANLEYVEGELYKNITYDENHSGTTKNHTTEEYTDKQGRVVLKRTYADMDLNGDGDTADLGETEVRHDTYYIYDDFGNLTYVLPPKMDASSASLATLVGQLDELGYQYVYDHRNRLVEKQLPGKGREYIVYNKLDQPIMTQDALQSTSDEWLFTKYDAFGRVAYTGKAVESNRGRNDVQADVDNLTGDYWVDTGSTFNMNGISVGYGNTAYPTTTATEVLTVNYYDDYAFVPQSWPNAPTDVFGASLDTSTQGLVTGSRVRVLGTDNWITTATYYDEKARPIYTYSENAYLGTVDLVESELDFVGRPQRVRAAHTRSSVTVATLDNFTYDHVGRLLKQTQCIGDETLGYNCVPSTVETNLELLMASITSSQVATNRIEVKPTNNPVTVSGTLTLRVDANGGGSGGAEELIAFNNYDELGQLIQKKVGGIPGTVYADTLGLQTVDYAYNVRGWLKSINQDADNLDNDLFNFGIHYNTVAHGGTPLYNGNIAETEWETTNDNTQRWYRYGYDALNRIKEAIGAPSFDFDVSSITYDRNGNMLTLEREGHLGPMDDLTYNYHNSENSNRLQAVADSASGTEGFVDGVTSSTEYVYDANGNMIQDDNKGITSISYNHLNLPTNIVTSSGNISYVYDAAGTKLRKTVGSSVTSYAGNYIYSGATGNETLEFFSHPEGYVTDDGLGGYDYVYQYKDHLGNVRLSYVDNNGTLEIVEESNYYPFGLKHKGYNTGTSPLGNDVAQRWKFGGKEYDDTFGLETYDFGARNYDAAIGRWMNIDPLADKYLNMSPYNYTLDNPIIFVDPDGMRVEWAKGLTAKEKQILGFAINYLRKNSETFNKQFTELHSSEVVFEVGKTGKGGPWGLYTRPTEIMEGGDEDEDGMPTELTLRYDLSEGARGGKISVNLDTYKELRDEGIDIDPVQEAIEVFPEEFSGAALFLYYGNQANGLTEKMPGAANIEYETKMLSGIMLNEASINLSRSENQRAAQQFGIDFAKGNYTIKDYFNALKTWHENPKTDKYYRGLSRDNSRPGYTENLKR